MPYATYPSTLVRETPGSKSVVDQLLWGDFLREEGPRQDGWLKVKGRGGAPGWILETEKTDERPIEICFVDIGQGDGSLIVVPGATPDKDRFLLVDAGEGDNMYRFLRWRFNLGGEHGQTIPFEAAVITHPDSDHYKGFGSIFEEPRFRFRTVYHNGIVERAGSDSLGPVANGAGGLKYLTELVTDLPQLGPLINDPANSRKLYPRTLRRAADAGVREIRMLCADDGHLPGFGPGERVHIEVLGPVPETGPGGGKAMRLFAPRSKPGPTKNGHSIILRLHCGAVTVLLGGDLNVPAENYLLRHYTGKDPEAADTEQQEVLVQDARRRFEADFAKACHHGSADFSSLFLRSVNALATVVSSGDNEPHCHPRPDALGAFGKHGRGERPLIFSTELARSAREQIKEPRVLRALVEELYSLREQTTSAEARAKIQQKIDAALGDLDRSVAVYGMINLRTDGRRAVMAQKLEERRSSTGEEWDIHRFEPDPAGGPLRYKSKHEG